jgi:hypothetical protein
MKLNAQMIAVVLTAVALNVALVTGYTGLDEKWVSVTSAALAVIAGLLPNKK